MSRFGPWPLGVVLVVCLFPAAVSGADGVEGGAEPSPSERVAPTPEGADDLEKLAAQFEELFLTPEPYYYESLGRRDPFISLISEEYRAANASAQPGSDELLVVGILWAENDRFALVETEDGRSTILREGSQLGDGTVLQVLPDRIIVHVTKYGTSRNVTLPLVQGGSFHESPRSRSR